MNRDALIKAAVAAPIVIGLAVAADRLNKRRLNREMSDTAGTDPFEAVASEVSNNEREPDDS